MFTFFGFLEGLEAQSCRKNAVSMHVGKIRCSRTQNLQALVEPISAHLAPVLNGVNPDLTTIHDLCMSSLHRGYANLLCIVTFWDTNLT